MHPAILYKKIKNNLVQCQACAHYCAIKEGKTGKCGVRQNVGGRLQLLVYGRPVGLQVDPIEKKPLYHFLPGTKILSFGTFGCNFKCEFCQNWDMSQTYAELTQNYTPEEIVALAVKYKTPSIAYTYNEPAIFAEYARDIMVLAQDRGLKNVWVSNGYFSKETLEYIGPYLDAINIDLKSFSDEFYQKICGAHLQPVLETIKRVHKRGIHQEITTLLIPGENDSDKELKQIAEFITFVDKNIPWHISRFHPDYKMLDKDITPYGSLTRAREIGLKAGLKYIYLGNI